MPYRCEAASVEGFVQYLSCNLVNKGYWYYVTGQIPERKDPINVDQKLILLYGLELSKWARARRKAKGNANVAYLRYERFFVLLATQGKHILFEREGQVEDIRQKPIRFHGYCIGCGKGSDGKHHASVKIGTDAYDELVYYFLNLAVHRSRESLAAELGTIRYVPYARVRRQLLRLLREVNELRQRAGFESVPPSALPLSRKIVKVFNDPTERNAASNNFDLLPIKGGNTCDEVSLNADGGCGIAKHKEKAESATADGGIQSGQ